MSDMREAWDDYKAAMKEEREAKLGPRVAAIRALVLHGLTVEELNPNHFRIGGVLDLYPVRQRYHYIPLNKRGGFSDPLLTAKRFCRMTERD